MGGDGIVIASQNKKIIDFYLFCATEAVFK